ncbi:MAG TPA: hypothetical protein VIM03_01850 [Thermoleophilaceae bacterium]|jgi:hypothetical protein
MSATLTTTTAPFLRPGADGSPRPRRLTLEQRLEGSLRDLSAGTTADCPLCRAPMKPAAGGGGECTGCGSHLS